MPRLAVIADDLTGATDTGVQFRKFGLRTFVLLDLLQPSPLPQDADIIVLDTDSRAVPVATSSKRVGEACRKLRELGIDSLYKKIDSTLRGNLGVEIAAVHQELNPTITVIAPAYPQNRRVTIGGYQLLDGLPVSLTEIGHDPKTPVTEAWIPELVKVDNEHKVGLVPLKKVLAGTAAIYHEMLKLLTEGIDWIVCDAVNEENLGHIAEAALRFERILWVGSAGLAEHLPRVCGWKQDNKRTKMAGPGDPVLVVAGSVSAVTQAQIQAYLEKTSAHSIVIDSEAAVLTPANEVRRIVNEANRLLQGKQRDIVISCSGDRQVIDQAIQAGKSKGLTAREVGAGIAEVLGLTVAELAAGGVAALFLTGGETAISSCRALGASGIEILEEVLPGIPLGQLNGGPFHGLPVITKAGAFGNTHAIIKAVNVLKGYQEQSS